MGASCSSAHKKRGPGDRGVQRRGRNGSAEWRALIADSTPRSEAPSDAVVPRKAVTFWALPMQSLPAHAGGSAARSRLGIGRCCGMRTYPGVQLSALLKLRALAEHRQQFEGPPRDWLKSPTRRQAGERLTTDDVLHEIVLVATAERKCAYHKLLPREQVGVATVYVSHARTDIFVDLVDVLACANFQAERACFAIDVLTISPHGPLADLSKRADELKRRVRACESFVLVLSHATRPAVLRNIWCLFELHAASLGATELHVELPRSQRDAFDLAISTNLDAVHAALIDVRDAAADARKGGSREQLEMVDAVGRHVPIGEVEERAVLVMRAWLAETAMYALQRQRGDQQLMHSLARLQHARGDSAGEELVLRMLVRVAEEEHGESHMRTMRAVVELARALAGAGKLDAAAHSYRRALDVCEQRKGWAHPETLHIVLHLAHVLMARGKEEEAEALFIHAELGYAHMGATQGARAQHSRTRLLATYHGQGVLLQQREQWEQAEAKLRLALSGREEMLGPTHPETLASALQLASVLDRMGGRQAEADALYSKANRGRISTGFARQSSIGTSESSSQAELEQMMLAAQVAPRRAIHPRVKHNPTLVKGAKCRHAKRAHDDRPVKPMVHPHITSQ